MLFYVSLFVFFSCLCLIFLQKGHFLSVLLMLELMSLGLFMFIMCTVSFSSGGAEVSFGLVFLVFGVYEAANGLGLLVSRTRSTGVDKLSSLFSMYF